MEKGGKLMQIDRNEVLRYLRCYNEELLDSAILNMVDECIAEIGQIARESSTYAVFEISGRGEEHVELGGAGIVLRGRSIAEHLADCDTCAVMAATLGGEVDRRIRTYSKTDLTRSIVLDSCATAGIESVCDICEESIKQLASEQGYGTNFRFSPGYGDMPLDVQPQILRALDAYRRIGLTVTESLILVPRKSVTAIVGFTKNKERSRRTCAICSMNGKCEYQKRGMTCGS
ncbi:hypothetical protein EAL2_808p00500 (plasmid) [Peptoclostridium acidaminophilum DSM 3953]|uniref:Uncharacterized protein n=2 Tax=Peptoclostridium acidaminophilum TaxID=1731 RepID=W8TMZ0_PEPAC|nr:hypothetical protein EAL2_808p00500 [Peptoclostridium acidaminophilum DSM 3953]